VRDHGGKANLARRSRSGSENGMNDATWQRLFGARHALDEPLVVVIMALLALGLVISPLIIIGLDRSGRLAPSLKNDLWQRYWSWLVLIPLITLPILLGAFWTMLGVALLSLVCFREFSRAIGFFREKLMNILVILSIIALNLAALDKWYNLFVALTPIVIVIIAAVSTSLDRPKGFIQRVALAALSFLLFGTCLGHLSYLANSVHYRSLLLLLIFSVQMNDVFAYIVGKSVEGPKLAPQTSPSKTISGSLAAIILTTLLVYLLGGIVFKNTMLSGTFPRLALGLMISIAGQFGDLTVSAIKRDVGVKDTGTWIPGHGGVLDRANSLLLATPALFHYLSYFRSLGIDQSMRIFTGEG
jgi:phosphatidate cytidylyltransferase